MSNSDWLYLLVFSGALFGVVLLAELVRYLMKWSSEATRKLVHILVGILVATTPYLFESKWPMVGLGVLFVLFDFIAVKKNMLKGMHGTKRNSYGTVFYPISFVILVLLLWDHSKIILVISMLIMALSDAFAAIVGEKVSKPVVLHFGPEVKSVQGSATMFLTTFLIIFFSLLFFPHLENATLALPFILWTALVVSIIATVSEAISIQGSDNFSVPLLSAFALHFMLNSPVTDLTAFSLGMFLSLVVAVLSYKVKFLDAGGSATTFILATVVFGVGHWTFSLPILTFFVVSSILSKMGKKRKKTFLTIFEKSSQRDMWQVIANGGLAGLLVILWYFVKQDWIFVVYVASLAAVTADTWGTEIGVLSKSSPRSILTFKPVAPGTSGGVSFWGTLGATCGALLIGLVSMAISPQLVGFGELLIVVIAGVLASLVDSLLGATIQAQFKCAVCGKDTEKHIHCEKPTIFSRGLVWMNNDVVNIFCAASGIVFAYLGLQVLF